MSKVNLSIVLITLNEEKKLASCLGSLPEHRELIVLDSGSTDGTVNIAKKFGAKVYHRSFDNFANQKNAAISFGKCDWILVIDADEVLTSELQVAIHYVCKSAIKNKVYKVKRQLVFAGRKMRFGKTIDYPLRLFLKGSGKFVGDIHESFEADVKCRASILEGSLLHYSYNDLSDYFKKFNSYTSKVAQERFAKGRKAPKAIFLVLRLLFDFFRRYILRIGFLDGKEGFLWAFLGTVYNYIKYEKLREIIRVEQEKNTA